MDYAGVKNWVIAKFPLLKAVKSADFMYLVPGFFLEGRQASQLFFFGKKINQIANIQYKSFQLLKNTFSVQKKIVKF